MAKKADRKNVFVRTLTYAYLGEVSDETDREISLTKASWIADTGRFTAFASGKLDDRAEVEVYPPDEVVRLIKNNVVEVSGWPGTLPTQQK